jgi:ATP-binding cassette subfamily E protein 1
LKYFRGSELQNYFTKVLEDNLKAIIKPQYVDNIPKAIQGQVEVLMKAKHDNGNINYLMDALGILTFLLFRFDGGHGQKD